MIQIYSEERGLPIFKVERDFKIGIDSYSVVGASFNYPIKKTDSKNIHSILEVYKHHKERKVVCHLELYELMLTEEQLTEGINNISKNTTQWVKVQ